MCTLCNKNFFVNTHYDGKCPWLTRGRKPQSNYYAQYISDKPIVVAPSRGQDRVWDYSTNTMLGLFAGVKDYRGDPMPVYTGKVIMNKYAQEVLNQMLEKMETP